MLDIHNHILPGLDDGPASMEGSLEMALVALEDGIQTIVATPHSHDVTERSSLPAVRALADRLAEELQARSIPLKLLLGMENHLDRNIVEQVEKGQAVPIEGTSYILLELPFHLYPPYTEEVLFRLQLKGLRPIIVHPERNAQIQDNPLILANLVERGALSQLTAASVAGGLGRDLRKLSEELLRRGLVHVIASDGHSSHGSRKPVLSPGVAAAARIVGMETALRMVEDIPGAILRNEEADTRGLTGTSRRRGWWPPGR